MPSYRFNFKAGASGASGGITTLGAYLSDGQPGTADVYPAGGLNAGALDPAIGVRDTAGQPSTRMAGSWYVANDGTKQIRLDVVPGTYTLFLGAGKVDGGAYNTRVRALDGVGGAGLMDVSVTGNDESYAVDANGTKFAPGAWEAGQTGKQVTVTATSVILVIGGPTSAVGVTHLFAFDLIAAGGSPTPTVTSVTASPNPATVATGGSGQITVTVNGTNSPAQTVTASTSDATVATSNTAGVVSGIKAGSAIIRYTSTVDTSKYVDVSVTVTAVAPPPKAAIGVSTGILAFASALGGAAPLPQTFGVMNTGPNGTTLNASVAVQGASGGTAPAWLAAVLNAGVVTVTVTPGATAVGNYTGRVRVTDSAASNSPQDVYVTLAVTDATAAPTPITPDYPVSGTAEVLVLKPSWPVTFTVADTSKATVSPTTATSGTLGVETPQPGGGTALMYRATTTVSAVAPGKLGLTATASGYEPVGIALDIRAAKTA